MADLFPNDCLIGMFKGFAEEGLEFRAEIVAPYQRDAALAPRIGQFLLVELDHREEAALGRITRFFPVGLMASREGDEYLAEMHRSSSEVPAELKERRLRYSVKVRLLGGVRVDPGRGGGLRFVPTSRRLPHLGAKVGVPSEEVMEFLCGLSVQTDDASAIGVYALGETVFDGGPPRPDSWDSRGPRLDVRFDCRSLMSRRSFVFARAGYGKSNMLKLLISQLYKSGIPTDSSGRKVGMLILDPEGEYFWPDDQGRPGLCNVEWLKDRIAVFTDRAEPNAYYGSWRRGGVRLDVRELKSSDVVSLCISAERQEQQNVNKLRSLREDRWRKLVDYVHEHRHQADEKKIQQIAGFSEGEAVEARAIRSNLTTILTRLHDPDGQLQQQARDLLAEGMIVIVDLSLLSGTVGLQVSGLLLKSIFDNNQRSFTLDAGQSRVVPVIAVLEEAQSVLGRNADDESPFVAWAKEGRKYGLGAVMVTQQPGSMSPQLLSQGDNFFTFHLLSAHDLKTLQHHNAHFSDDILAAVMNEPIKGNCYFWSAPDQPFVLSARIADFATIATDFPATDAIEKRAEVKAARLDAEHEAATKQLIHAVRDTLTARSNDHGIEFYLPPGTTTGTATQHAACYKPRLAARVGENLPEDLQRKFTTPGRSGTAYVRDEALEDALRCIVQELQVIRAVRGDRVGDYYLIPTAALPEDTQLRTGLKPPTSD